MEMSLIDLFEAQVLKSPDDIAVIFEKKQCTYRELNERSNTIAWYLRGKGVKTETLVPLFMERGIEMLAGMLGIMKAGGAYVPLDTDFPPARIAYMLQDTCALIVVSSKECALKLKVTGGIEVIEVEAITNQPQGNLPAKVLPGHLAYVIYTSGSTGIPKGVMIEHRNITDYINGLNDKTGINDCSSFGLVSTIATDLGNTVIFPSLVSGGALHIFSKESVSNIEHLHNYFAVNNIDCLKIVPSHWKALSLDDKLLLPSKLVIFGGEALPAKMVDDIQAAGTECIIVNHYGPTETTIGKLLYIVVPGTKHEYTIPIGKPFSQTKVLVLTKNLKLCPIGVPGQLYITGNGLARGYLNNPELTNEKFIQNPFSKKGNSLMYATGDLVKYLADGNILFIGRADNQVKIRGYRIELGEIENMLQQCDLVSQAVVLAADDKPGNKRLVGYIVADQTFNREEILSYLKNRLPDYMIPSVLMEIKSFPLTANGKVDRKALPDPDDSGLPGNEYVAPRNETEEKLAALWQDILEVAQVGINDDFFELGGHSLLAVRLVSAIRKAFVVEMPIGDIFDYPTVSLLAARLGNQSNTSVLPVIVKAKPPANGRIPLSFSQERIWFMHQLSGSLEYHVPSVVRLTGSINKDALAATLKNIVQRHEILRTVYIENEGEPYQHVMDSYDCQLLLVDGKLFVNDEPGLKKYIQQQINITFDLSADYMLRAVLISLKEDDHILLITLHHIASDGWSRSVLINDFGEFYSAYTEGRIPNLAPLPLTYSDFSIWQRNYLQGEVLSNKLQYWSKQLEGVPALQLLTDFPRPAMQSTAGANTGFYIDKELSGALHSLSQQQGTTLFMTLLSAFKVLLYRYTSQQDICVGTPIAGRQQQETEGMIGFFINTLALRTQVNPDGSFVEILQQVRAVTLKAYENQDVPFEKVVEVVSKERDLSRSPVFQVMFVLQNTPPSDEITLPELTLTAENLEIHTSKFDISFYITETANGLHCSVEYCTALFMAETITRMISHYKALLAAVVKTPGQKIGLLPMYGNATRQYLLHALAGKISAYPGDKNLLDLFEEQAFRSPLSTALIFEKDKATYQQINEQANMLASYLHKKGIKAGALVPVCIERSFEMVIAILGVLKAGAAYVPIDPDYPKERITFILRDTGATDLITNKNSKASFVDKEISEKLQGTKSAANPDQAELWNGVEIICVEDVLTSQGDPLTKLSLIHVPGSGACVIYTSGSSGHPKGVTLTHTGITNRLHWMWKAYPFKSGEVNAIKTSIGFVDHIWELFGALNKGIVSVIFSKPTLLDLNLFIKKLQVEKITRLVLVPSLLKALLNKLLEDEIKLPNLRYLTSSGETLPVGLVTDFYKTFPAANHTLLNIYGSTEVTADVTCYDTSAGYQQQEGNVPHQHVPIGKPIANTSVYLIDSLGQLTAPGIAGEICVTGVQVALGYLNLPQLTDERFIPDTFNDTSGAKLFRTGDFGRLLSDGNIGYLGRIDDQVKIRGNRVELGEVEAVLQKSGLIKQCVLTAKADNSGDNILIGYIVADVTIDKQALSNSLRDKLPDYMVPSLWVQMQVLPMTESGKVDKKALPEPSVTELTGKQYMAPGTEMEKQLQSIWQQLLSKEEIGIHHDFFEVGGHSLLAMRVVSAIRKVLNIELSIKDLFLHSTIASLAGHLQNQTVVSLLPAIEVLPRPPQIPLSYSQERLWFIDRLEGSSQYHLPVVVRLTGNLNVDALSVAIQNIVERHEVLRTVINEEEGRAYQKIKTAENWTIKKINAAEYDNHALHTLIKNLIDAPFNLSKDYMLRANLVTLNQSEHLLVATIHHIASDGWSMSVIVKELSELYSSIDQSRQSYLSSLPVQYADFAIWQRKYLQGDAFDKKLDYWKNKLQGTVALQLTTDYPRPSVQSTNGAITGVKLSKELSDQLHALSLQQGTTLFMTLLSVVNVLLYRYSGQQDICVGTPVAGRQHQELEGLIGFFINTLTLRTELAGKSSFKELLQQVKSSTLEAYDHQEVPFEKVVEAVVKERDMSRSPLFQVMLVLQNTPEIDNFQLGEVQLSRGLAGLSAHTTSKFDLTFNIAEASNGLQISIEYCTGLYNVHSINRMLVHFEELLNSVVKIPEQKIGLLPMLPDSEVHKLLVDFNNIIVPYRENKTIVSLFEEQVLKTPDAIATIFNEEKLTYKDLNIQSNKLAWYLHNKGVTSGMPVPICIDRSTEMIIGILGILKAGGAYVPIDPGYPQERMSFVLEDTGASIVITNNLNRLKLPILANVEIIDLDSNFTNIDLYPPDNLMQTVAKGQLAYIIYTSGSTGKPKGVMVGHCNLASYLLNNKNKYIGSVENNAGSYIHLSYTFDASITALLMPLICGKFVVIGSKQSIDVFEDNNLLKYAPYAFIKITPSHLELLQPKFKAFTTGLLTQKLIIGGEALQPSQFHFFINEGINVEVINEYGPTETTVGCSAYTFKTVTDKDKIMNGIPIGKPMNNMLIYILDENNELVPIGSKGEICIGGAQVCHGYLNRPQLTAEKFINNPFDIAPGAKLYKSGDVGRWLQDGNIEYMGRVDGQIKIGGHRVEPGEIEACLLQSGLVSQAVVLALEDVSGIKRLVGYIASEKLVEQSSLISYLESQLPRYMVPASWVTIETMPLTLNGKIDKMALPSPKLSSPVNLEYVAPHTETEKQLASIWKELLHRERISIHDNFFELGGDSILTIQVVSRARRLGIELHPKDLFVHQTVDKLSAAVAKRLSVNIVGEQGILTGFSGLIPIQQWWLEMDQQGISYFNQSVLLGLDKTIIPFELNQAFKQIMEHHDALRFKYFLQNNKWQQEYGNCSCEIITEDIQSAPPSLLASAITEKASTHQGKLDIKNGELIRVVWMQTPGFEKNNRLFIVIHHLAMDGVSWRILLEDLELLLTGIKKGEKTGLGSKTSSFRQWFHALENYGKSRQLLSEINYWRQAEKSYHALPVDKDYAYPIKAKDIVHYGFRLSARQTSQLLQDVPRVYHTGVNDILLAALARTITDWSNLELLSIGLEGHGREAIGQGIDTSRTIGWFTSLYPLPLSLQKIKSEADLIKSVKEQLRQLPGKGLGYGVLKYINRDSSFQKTWEPWDIIFNYLGQLDNVVGDSKWLSGAGESQGPVRNNEQVVSEKMSINSSVRGGELIVNWSYSSKHYHEETIKKLTGTYLSNLEKLIAHCIEQHRTNGTVFTPSDCGLGSVVSYTEMDSFLDKPFNNKTQRETVDTLYRLSGLQQGILFHSLYETGFGTYVHQFGCDLIGTDLNIFKQSWNSVIRAHSILRSAFYHDVFSVPVQCVYKEVELPVEFMDLRNMGKQAQENAISDYENTDRYKSFDYKTAPLMRLALLQVSDNRYRMIWTWHHILFDGWSMPVLMEEFLTTYEALAGGNKINPVKEDVYEEYIRYMDSVDKEKEEHYWRNYLKGVEQNTLLPFIKSTNERTKGAGTYKTLTLQLDSAATLMLQRYAQSNHITLNTVMQGVWACLLHQYTGKDNIVFGVIVSGRPEDLTGIEKRVGLYINAVPFHTNVQDQKNMINWLQNLQTEQVESRQYQYTALSDIQGWTGIQGDLFDNLLVFDNYPVSKIISSRQWSLQVENPQLHEQNNYPLSIVIISNPDQITIQFLYNTALIHEAYANSLRNHFEHVLLQVASGKCDSIGDLSFLTQAEESQLLFQFNDTAVNYPAHKTVIDIFEEQAQKTPHAIALVFKDAEITYHRLNEHANQLAQYLISKGVKEDIPVPVCIEKSFEMFIGILGILKAGGAYVPVDPQYPADRVKYMVEDTKAAIVLSSLQSSGILNGISGIEIIELDETASLFTSYPVANVNVPVAAGNLAYIIYTSGSTGKPKGVMIEHRNLFHYIQNNKTKYLNDAGKGSGSFIHLSYTFDASITAMFMPLLAGKLVVIGSKQSAEVFEDTNLWKYAPYDFIKITPSHLEFLQASIKNENGALLTNKLIIGGEALNAGHLNFLIESNINLQIINEYGPTEATVGCSVYSFNTLDNFKEIKSNIPVGKPLDNIQLYILNEGDELVPVGVVGQICVGGDGVARGYLNLPGLTKEKFVHNPYSNKNGAVMYKTGDLGRWLPDGNIEYLGRLDDQVKLNGYRIELGEIESALSAVAGISNSKVIVKENKAAGSFKLNAYVQTDKEKLQLLSSYLRLLNKNQAQQSDLHLLPNGLPVLSSNLNEVRFLYNEIFEDHCYLKHGISLKEDSCVFDVGANVGFFTVYLNILSKNIRIYSVEPIPDVYNYLVANRELYGIRGKAFQLAVSDKEGEVDFTWYPQVSIVSGMSNEISQVKEVVRSYIDNSKKENFKQEEIESLLNVKLETRQIRCKTKTLSQIIEEENIEKIDLLKVDVENSEHLVMNGILDKDWEKIGSVIIEVHDVNGRLSRIRETLEGKGFKTHVEKEKMLSKDDILYNLFALKNEVADGLTSLGNNEKLRKKQWADPDGFVRKLETELKEKLPAYMVPANIVLMDQFPLTSNGKIDKTAFPDVDAGKLTGDQFIAPRTELEEKLAEIWKHVLDVEKVGIHDDFFNLGGDSLLSIRLISSIRKELEIELAISTFFELITIEKIANYIRHNQHSFSVEFENYEEIKL